MGRPGTGAPGGGRRTSGKGDGAKGSLTSPGPQAHRARGPDPPNTAWRASTDPRERGGPIDACQRTRPKAGEECPPRMHLDPARRRRPEMERLNAGRVSPKRFFDQTELAPHHPRRTSKNPLPTRPAGARTPEKRPGPNRPSGCKAREGGGRKKKPQNPLQSRRFFVDTVALARGSAPALFPARGERALAWPKGRGPNAAGRGLWPAGRTGNRRGPARARYPPASAGGTGVGPGNPRARHRPATWLVPEAPRGNRPRWGVPNRRCGNRVMEWLRTTGRRPGA